VDLAVRENSFVAEYRVDVGRFNLLHQMLETSLEVNETKASAAMHICGSAPISTASRLGAALERRQFFVLLRMYATGVRPPRIKKYEAISGLSRTSEVSHFLK
jgi:hypothetical protein